MSDGEMCYREKSSKEWKETETWWVMVSQDKAEKPMLLHQYQLPLLSIHKGKQETTPFMLSNYFFECVTCIQRKPKSQKIKQTLCTHFNWVELVAGTFKHSVHSCCITQWPSK